MTRIPKISSIDSLAKTGRISSPSVKKKTVASSQKPVRSDITQLKKNILILLENDKRPAQQVKETVIKEIIKWQFGESAFADPKFIRAFDKMASTIETSPAYKEIFDTFLKHAK